MISKVPNDIFDYHRTIITSASLLVVCVWTILHFTLPLLSCGATFILLIHHHSFNISIFSDSLAPNPPLAMFWSYVAERKVCEEDDAEADEADESDEADEADEADEYDDYGEATDVGGVAESCEKTCVTVGVDESSNKADVVVGDGPFQKASQKSDRKSVV